MSFMVCIRITRFMVMLDAYPVSSATLPMKAICFSHTFGRTRIFVNLRTVLSLVYGML